MIGRYLLLIGMIFLFCGTVSAQESCMPYIKGYRCYEFNYFDSLHKIYGDNIKSLDRRYEIYVSFRLDTAGKMNSLKITDLPINRVPKSVRKYVAKLLRLSSGMWEPVVKEGKKVNSDEVIYRFDVIKKDRKISEGTNEELKFVEYYYGDGLKNKMLQRFFNSGAKTVFIYYE